ncbi:lamin tail domain-containing protein [Candidatus Sumerlaeota bacterium]|nr:lamin tail domain-containing protein [Candidatus Sumerlaeota bacterium]
MNFRIIFQAACVTIFFVSMPAPALAQLTINEFMASNNASNQDSQGDFDDWIEIYNAGAEAVDLAGMYLTDDLDELNKHQIPTGYSAQTTVPAGGWLILWADEDTADGPEHLGFKLSADGEDLALVSSDGVTVVDSITFGEQETDISSGRYPDGGTVWFLFTTPTPMATNAGGFEGEVADTKFSQDRGFYDAPISLEITTETSGATIRYTTDGSLPTETTGTIYTGPISISQTTCVRAIAYKLNYIPTNVDTHTYIFPADVLQQTGAGLPASWVPDTLLWGNTDADYEMDPDIVTDPVYADRMTSSLLALPSVSLVLPVDDMFGASGIYPNGEGDPRATSVELIDPSGALDDFQSDCTVEVFGGTSVERFKIKKLQFRLRFKPPEGPTKLNADIFGEYSTDEFDNLILNARLGNTWAYNGGVEPDVQRSRAQFVRDQFAANVQNELSGFGAPHGIHVHLYIDGLYWGIYGLHERPDESFAEAYYGGDKDDYDVLKHNWYTAANGTVDNYQAMVALARSGLSSNQQYLDFQEQLEIAPFIDYILTYFYIGVIVDWAQQNWYASRNIQDPDATWHYHVWDAEHCLEYVTDNATGKNNTGAPTEVHQLLTANAEYRLQFADHVHRHCFNDGALTTQGAQNIFLDLLDRVDPAIPAESARWGDNVYPDDPYTRDDDWMAERTRLLTTWFPLRTGILLDQLRSCGLYPDVDAPVFNINGSYQHGGEISSGDLLTMDNLNAGGTIYYTLDGTDPRSLPSGNVDATVLVADDAEIHALTPASASDGAGSITGAPLLIDFGQPATPVESGYAAYIATHENLATFTSQTFSAFDTTITVTPTWAPGVVNAAAQMIDRGGFGSDSPDLLRDWIGTDTRELGNPLTITLSGVPAGVYSWRSYHHDANDQTGTFEATINDALGSRTTNDIDITNGAILLADAGKLMTMIVSDGSDISIVFNVTSGGGNVSYAFFVMNGFELTAGDDWKASPAYNDATWATGNAGVGYETSSGYESYFDIDTQSAMFGGNNSCYVRIPFTVDGASLDDFTNLTLGVRYDDGFIAYLNGILVAQANAPASPAWNSSATADHSDSAAVVLQNYDITAYLSALVAGDNILAIHGLNTSNTSSDFLIDAELTALSGDVAGTASLTALPYSGAVALTDTVNVKARVLVNSEWSALNDAVYTIDTMNLLDSLRITEVMYNPAPPPVGSTYNNDDFEFIEFKNTGPVTLDAAGACFSDGIDFGLGMTGQRTDSLLLAPGEYGVIVKNRKAFVSRYGSDIRILGEYRGSLDNNGERVRISDSGTTSLITFEYDNARGWPQSPDGAGHSLVPREEYLAAAPDGSLYYGGNWRASSYIHGSPGEEDPDPPAGVVLNEFAAHTDYTPAPPDSNDWIELYNPGAAVTLNDYYLSDDISDLTKWAIPNGTQIPVGGFLSFDEINDFHVSDGFGLAKDGERVVLSYLPGTAADRVVDEIRFKGQENGVSLGRYEDGLLPSDGPDLGAWHTMTLSRGTPNAAPVADLIISQLMYHPADDDDAHEYVEIYNPTDQAVEMWNTEGAWRLSGGIEYEFTGNVTVPAKGRLLVVNFDPANATDLADFQAAYGVSAITAALTGPSTGVLSNRMERIALERPQAPDAVGDETSWVIVDEVIYFEQAPFPESADGAGDALHRVLLNRSGDAPQSWSAAPPYLDRSQIAAPFIGILPASNLTATSAMLRGELVDTGGEEPAVYVYWGTVDGGETALGWQYSQSLGTYSTGGIAHSVYGLAPSAKYYCRLHAQNSAGEMWTSPVEFTTPSAGPSRVNVWQFY